MRGSYQLRDWEKPFLQTKFTEWINILNAGKVDGIDLTHENICLANAEEVLESLGWCYDLEEDNSHDFWIYYTKENKRLCLFINVGTFDFNMSIEDMEEDL